MDEKWLDDIKWTADGLVPAIAEDAETKVTLMMAWMNRESLLATLESGNAVYWSRSRQRLWRKGEESGHQQIVKEIRVDCDMDTILLRVEQRGGIACHTGRHNCFFYKLADKKWQVVEPVIKNPDEIYSKSK